MVFTQIHLRLGQVLRRSRTEMVVRLLHVLAPLD